MSVDYKSEAIKTYTALTDLRRRAASEAKAKEKKLPDYFTLEGRIRCKPALLIQTICEDLGGDVDRISPKVRIAAERKFIQILKRYNCNPQHIHLASRIMSPEKIAKWK